MANVNTKKGVIGILTGGGDVPGLNPAIRGVTLRALHEGYDVIGLRRREAAFHGLEIAIDDLPKRLHIPQTRTTTRPI